MRYGLFARRLRLPRRKSDLTTHHINLYSGDLEVLSDLVPGGPPAKIIRELVRSTIQKVKANDPEAAELKVKINV